MVALLAGVHTFFPSIDRHLFQLGHYEWADVHHVYDGDTLTVVKLENGSFRKQRVRLLDIDTAELGNAQCESERDLAVRQRDYLESMAGSRVRLYITGNDKYGRLLAEVYNEAGENLNERMLKEAGARSYSGGWRMGWC